MYTQFGLVIVGDEILSGRRTDKHLAHIAQSLSSRGLNLAWARYVGDQPAAQTALYRETMASDQIVISCGGIGATPDDHTRQSAAAAADVPLIAHPEATAIIVGKFGDAAYPNRVKMAEFPAGATLIPNPVNQIAGFSLGHHHFVPGFPDMAWPMVDWVLDSYYSHLFSEWVQIGCIVPEAKEGDLIPVMETLVKDHPGILFSCLPSYGNERQSGMHIEFTIRGQSTQAAIAYLWLETQLKGMQYTVRPIAAVTLGRTPGTTAA